MKLLRYFIAIILLGSIVFYSNCGGGGEEPKLTDTQKLAKTLSSISWGGANKVTVNSFPNGLLPEHYAAVNTLKLTFSVDSKNDPTTFKAEGGGNIFPDFTGTYSISGTGPYTVTISGTNPDITQLSDFTFEPNKDNPTAIKFTFNSQCAACRTNDVTGNYTVTLAK